MGVGRRKRAGPRPPWTTAATVNAMPGTVASESHGEEAVRPTRTLPTLATASARPRGVTSPYSLKTVSPRSPRRSATTLRLTPSSSSSVAETSAAVRKRRAGCDIRAVFGRSDRLSVQSCSASPVPPSTDGRPVEPALPVEGVAAPPPPPPAPAASFRADGSLLQRRSPRISLICYPSMAL